MVEALQRGRREIPEGDTAQSTPRGVPAAAEGVGDLLPWWPRFLGRPDRCDLNVDVRTTPTSDAHDAETLVRKAVAELDAELPAPKPTEVTPVATWLLFRLAEDEQPAAALLSAAVEAKLAVRAKTAGPSNIGNLMAGEGIPATAGFGLPYEGLHGIDERELPQVYALYHHAVLDLLRAGGCLPGPGFSQDPRPSGP